MGHPGEYDHPDVQRPMQEMLELCLKHGVPFGTTASGPEAGAEWVRQGCRFFEVEDELNLIRRAATETVNAYRSGREKDR